MSSFNRRFASFYYNMPKEIQPLENAAKIYYATNFPPQLALLLLERKSVTLQHVFIDYLEVEDNRRLSKFFSDQDNGDKMEKELELVERYEQEELALPSNSIFCEKKVDQTNDVQRKIKLRNRYVTINKGRINQNQASSSQHNT